MVPAVLVLLSLLPGIRLNPSTDKVRPAVKRRPVSLVSGFCADEEVPVLEVDAGAGAAGCESCAWALPKLSARHAHVKPASFFRQSSKLRSFSTLFILIRTAPSAQVRICRGLYETLLVSQSLGRIQLRCAIGGQHS